MTSESVLAILGDSISRNDRDAMKEWRELDIIQRVKRATWKCCREEIAGKKLHVLSDLGERTKVFFLTRETDKNWNDNICSNLNILV